MVLYNVNVPGLRSALNVREISHLLRTGQVTARTNCKVKGAASWSTIGELFPLLEPTAATYFLPGDPSQKMRRFRRILGLTTLLAAITIGSFFLRGRFNRDSASRDSTAVSLQRVSDSISLADNKDSK